MRDLESFLSGFKEQVRVAVAVAEDRDVLKSLSLAWDYGIASGILVGDQDKIRFLAREEGLDLSPHEIIHQEDGTRCCEIAVSLVREGRAQALMKGLIDTSIILKAALDRERGLRNESLMSHLAVFELPSYPKLLFLADAAVNITPSLEEKKLILQNSLEAMKRLGVERPKVAVICAKEKVNPKMKSTLDAQALVEAFGESCLIEGPIALDGAISKEAAVKKGIDSELAGEVDLLLMDNLEAANALYKALPLLGNARNGGIMVGTLKPIILTSRIDSFDSKLISIALGVRA